MRIEKTPKNNRANRALLLLFSLVILACLAFSPAASQAPQGPAPSVQITEILARNTSAVVNADGRLCGYVKLTNTGDTRADLAGWGLSDRPYKIRFVFPTLLLAPGESAFVFLSGSNTHYTGEELYAGFSVSSAGEIVTLFDGNGAVMDSVTVPALGEDEVYALSGDEWQIVPASSFPGAPQAAAEKPPFARS